MHVDPNGPLKRAASRALLVALALLPLAAAATDEPAAKAAPASDPPPPATVAPAPKPWYEEIAVNGFVSASYSYGFNRPASGTNQLRVFDFDDDTIKLDVATLTLQKAVAKPGEAGFRVDASAGGSYPRVESSYGLFQGQDFDLKQAFLSWIAPVGSGLRLDAGKFVTCFNYEFIDSWDTPNDNATRSFGFYYGVPGTHTGIKATYAFSDRLATMLMLVTGWDDARDNNSAKSVGANLTYTPSKAVTLTASFITGPERAGVNSDPRTVYEIVAQWKLTDLTVFGLDALHGTERGAVTPGETAAWSGLAAYARLGLSSTFALCLRAEVFDDRDGARTGTAQTLTELTLTPELKVTPHLTFRADLRLDSSDRPVFEDHGGALSKKSQPTVLLNALYLF